MIILRIIGLSFHYWSVLGKTVCRICAIPEDIHNGDAFVPL
jgi:hypothetical protein